MVPRWIALVAVAAMLVEQDQHREDADRRADQRHNQRVGIRSDHNRSSEQVVVTQHTGAKALFGLAIAATALLVYCGVFDEDAGATPPSRDRLIVALKAGPNGELAAIQIAGGPPTKGPNMLLELRNQVERAQQILREANLEEAEFAFQVDDRLQFQELVQVLIAVRKTTTADGKVVPLAKDVTLQTEGFDSGVLAEYHKYLQYRDDDQLRIRLDAYDPVER